MPDPMLRYLICLLLALVAGSAGFPASAASGPVPGAHTVQSSPAGTQTTKQPVIDDDNDEDDDDDSDIVQVPVNQPAKQKKIKTPDSADEDDEAETPAAPEPPKAVISIEINNNQLSVDLENADFGAAVRAIAEKAKFRIEGSGEVFNRKITTKFSGLDVDQGVARLLSLVKESNYLIHYDTGGKINRLEIFRTAGGAAGNVQQPGMRTPLQPGHMPNRGISAPSQTPSRPTTIMPSRPTPVPVRPSSPPARVVQPQVFPDDDDDDDDEDEEEVPYVAPGPGRQIVPPSRK